MELQFIGAVRTVTGSMHMVTTGQSRILIDCGLFQGHRQEANETNRLHAQMAGKTDALVLSHAHIDHSGNIPTLVKMGFVGNIITTSATRDLCSAMLRDSAHIQLEDVAYLNRHRERLGQKPVEPLYDRDDADAAMTHFVGISYDRPFMVSPAVQVTLLDAGHILGSAVISMVVREGERAVRLGYAADLGHRGVPILRDPEVLKGLDYLIMESTYGARSGGTPEEARAALRRMVNETYQRGGKIIIPSFAVGRTQELIYDLYMLDQERKIPHLPIYVDSPLAVDVTEIFRLHPECYDAEMRRLLEQGHPGPLGNAQVTYVRTTEASKELNFLRHPAIIISASGMAESGRILHHLKNNLGDERNTVLFVGYQAENTLGRRIQEGAQKVHIFDQEVFVRARVESIEGYSAHADREGLLAYADAVAKAGNLKGIFLVHGEEESTKALADALLKHGFSNVQVPQPMDSVTL